LRKLARQAGRSHTTARELWDSGIHEARILATLVDDPTCVTERQADRWARQFDSWDICDQACQNLFRYTPFAFDKAAEWAHAKPEFVRRAGFALMAGLAVTAAAAEVKLGVVEELTGAVATYGQNTVKGIRLAVEEANAKGGVKGLGKVTLLVEDNKSDAAETVNAFNKLITRDRVVAIIGAATSGNTLAAAPVAQQSGIPVITPSGTAERVTEAGDYIFRACFIDPFQGLVMANFAYKDLKYRKIALMPEITSDYAMGLTKTFKEQFVKLGGKIVAEEKWSTGDQDFSAQLTKIRAAKPDAVYAGSYYGDVAMISRQARQLGLSVPFLGGDGFDSPKLFELGQSAVVGHYFTNHYSQDNPTAAAKAFLKAYRAKYNQDPDSFAALGYDSAKLMLAAMAKAKKADPKAIRDALASTKGFAGVTGKFSFDAKRNPVKSAVILQVEKDGSTKFVKEVEP
jgi:branched-chain amino acid transport system substrate-binding protein